jgi:hypothetical protein
VLLSTQAICLINVVPMNSFVEHNVMHKSKTDANIKHRFSFFPMAQQPPVGKGLLIIEASRSHADTPHSVVTLISGFRRDVDEIYGLLGNYMTPCNYPEDHRYHTR